MKTRRLISVFALSLAAGSVACSASSQPTPSADEPTSTTEQAQILGTAGNIIAWPAGAVTWTGLNATWPIAVWSPATIGALAFNVAGMTNLAITPAWTGAAITAAPITTPWLNAFVPPVGTAGFLGAPFFGTAGLNAAAFGFNGAFNPAFGAGFAFGAFGPAGALTGTWANGMLGAGLGWLTPTLTSSALMFNNLAPLSTIAPLTFTVGFTAQSAAQMAALNTASLSVFATPIATLGATTAAIPFMSMAFPIMPLPITAAPLL